MARFYFSCAECRKRMVRINEDSDGQRLFCLCRSCGKRLTYLSYMNGVSNDCPSDIFEDAVRDGIVTKEVRVL